MNQVWTRRAWMIGVMLAGAGMTAPAAAQDPVVKNVRATVSRSDPADVRVVAVFSNPSMYGVYLIGAVSDAAERVELRDARKRDAVVKEVEVPAFGSLTLDPKGVYLKLINLKRPLRPNTRVEVVVTTDTQVKLRLTAVVAAP
jgi:copper(I)-binding protein